MQNKIIMNIGKDLEFLYEIGTLRHIQREAIQNSIHIFGI